MVVWDEQSVCPRQPQQIVPFLLILSPSLSCSPPIPAPYFTFSNVSITAGHKPPCCVCVCGRARGREKETKEDHIKDFPCLLHPNVLPLSVSFSPLMWPVLISSADIAAVPSPLVEKDSFPTEKDALEHSTHAEYTQIHTHTQAPLNSERKRLQQKMASFEAENEKIRLQWRAQSQGQLWERRGANNYFSPFLSAAHKHTRARAHTQNNRDSNTQLFVTRTSSTMAFRRQLTKTDCDIFQTNLTPDMLAFFLMVSPATTIKIV